MATKKTHNHWTWKRHSLQRLFEVTKLTIIKVICYLCKMFVPLVVTFSFKVKTFKGSLNCWEMEKSLRKGMEETKTQKD